MGQILKAVVTYKVKYPLLIRFPVRPFCSHLYLNDHVWFSFIDLPTYKHIVTLSILLWEKSLPLSQVMSLAVRRREEKV